jgi:hypothetical protein
VPLLLNIVFSPFSPSSIVFGPPLLRLALQLGMWFNFKLVLGIPLGKLIEGYFMKLGVVMACLWIGMVASTRNTFHCCIFLMLICDVVFIFLVFWGFVCDSWGGLHPNDIFSWDSQVGVPKLGLLFSQNFGCSYLPQIKPIWIMWK